MAHYLNMFIHSASIRWAPLSVLGNVVGGQDRVEIKIKSFMWETYSAWCSHAQGTEFRCYDGGKAQDSHCSVEASFLSWDFNKTELPAQIQDEDISKNIQEGMTAHREKAHWDRRQDEGKHPIMVGGECCAMKLEAERIKPPSYVEI